jgi:hypothetical protein
MTRRSQRERATNVNRLQVERPRQEPAVAMIERSAQVMADYIQYSTAVFHMTLF